MDATPLHDHTGIPAIDPLVVPDCPIIAQEETVFAAILVGLHPFLEILFIRILHEGAISDLAGAVIESVDVTPAGAHAGSN
jgi:hypothetical protein